MTTTPSVLRKTSAPPLPLPWTSRSAVPRPSSVSCWTPRSRRLPPIRSSESRPRRPLSFLIIFPASISPIIPPSLLPLLASNLASPPVPSPTVFHVPPSYALTHLIHHPPPAPSIVPPIPAYPYAHRSITDALQAAINYRFSHRPISNTIKRSSTLPPHPGPSTRVDLHTKHTNPSSISLSLSLTVQSSSPPVDLHPSLAQSDSVTSPRSASVDSVSSIPPSLSIPFGNLFLSSCPGKKGLFPLAISSTLYRVLYLSTSLSLVRLDGPVKGRTGVCRDLDMDLKRMRELGVGCVIWSVLKSLVLSDPCSSHAVAVWMMTNLIF